MKPEPQIESLVQTWRDAALKIDSGTCGLAELEQRDMLYSCAAELEHALEKTVERKEAANDQIRRVADNPAPQKL